MRIEVACPKCAHVNRVEVDSASGEALFSCDDAAAGGCGDGVFHCEYVITARVRAGWIDTDGHKEGVGAVTP